MIHPEHRKEWLDSAVDEEIIDLNVRSLSGDAAISHLLYALPSNERRNDGRLRDSWLNRYRHVEAGGWWASGIDVLTGEDSFWGSFKPDRPQTQTEYNDLGVFKKQKVIKYEHPVKTATEIFSLRVTWKIGFRIAKKCGFGGLYGQRILSEIGFGEEKEEVREITPKGFGSARKPRKDGVTSNASGDRRGDFSSSLTPLEESAILESEILNCEDSDFWAWVRSTPEIPLLVTEGCKKAGSLLAAGYCAIALPGIFNGYRQEKDELGNKIGFPTLIPQLEIFAIEGREINFCFDRDTKPKTVKNVKTAIARTGKLLQRRGCDVKVIQWADPFKGIDDLIAAKGVEYFDAIYENRVSLEEFNLQAFLTFKPDLTINEQFFPDSLQIPDKAQLIALKGFQKTGKTQWLAEKIAPALNRGQRVIVIGHRERLMQELARRFGVDYRTEIQTSQTRGVFGYALCIDSLHPKANPPFNHSDWENAIVVIDEVEQVLWHLLNGDTCKNNRIAILRSFKQLLQTVVSTGGRIFIADADLCQISISYLRSLVGFPVETYIIENQFRPNAAAQRKCCSFNGTTPASLISNLERAIAAGQKAFILTDGQKHKSLWGTRSLEHYLKKKFPHLKILRVDRESLGDSKHPAFRCMRDLNTVLASYDVVICSPTMETGVSIDIKHFDGVWAIAHGVQTVDAVCQALERVRDDVPRSLWAETFSSKKVGSGETEIKSLLASTHKLTQLNINLLRRAGISETEDLIFYEQESESSETPSLWAWAKRACLINCQNRNYRRNILKKLSSMGYALEEAFEDSDDADQTKQAIKDSQQYLYGEHCNTVSQKENPSDQRFDQLRERRELTEDELIEKRKGELCRRYATEDVTPSLIEQDDSGMYPKWQLHYFLTIGNVFLEQRERRTVSKLKESGEKQVFKPDFNRAQLSGQIEALKRLEIEQFLDPNAKFTSDSLKEWFEKISQPLARMQIRTILGVTISLKDTAIGAAQRILDKLGLKMQMDRWQRIDGKAKRVYRGCDINPDDRQAIFSRWLQKEESYYLTPSLSA